MIFSYLKEKLVDYTRHIRDFTGNTITKPIRRIAPLMLVGLSLSYFASAAQTDEFLLNIGPGYSFDRLSTTDTQRGSKNEEIILEIKQSQRLLGIGGHARLRLGGLEADVFGWSGLEQQTNDATRFSLQPNNYSLQSRLNLKLVSFNAMNKRNLISFVATGNMLADRRDTQRISFETNELRVGLAMRVNLWRGPWAYSQIGIAAVAPDDFSHFNQWIIEDDHVVRFSSAFSLFQRGYFALPSKEPSNQPRHAAGTVFGVRYQKDNLAFEFSNTFRSLWQYEQLPGSNRLVKHVYRSDILQARVGIVF